MTLPSFDAHMRFRAAHNASPEELAFSEAQQIRILRLEALLRDAQDALIPYLQIVPGTDVPNRVMQVSQRIESALAERVG